uniref:hypothetical protein n=1 Tax=Amycolatopsis sp. CA-096443 TaxID=3239919 RepID=UPI003F499D76
MVLEVATGELVRDLPLSVDRHGPGTRGSRHAEDDLRRAARPAFDDVARVLADLAGRRFVSWDTGLRTLADILMGAGRLQPHRGDPTAWVGEQASYWHAFWLGETVPGNLEYPGSAFVLRGLDRDGDRSAEGLPARLAGDLAALRAMAAGPPGRDAYQSDVWSPLAAEVAVHPSALDMLVPEEPGGTRA